MPAAFHLPDIPLKLGDTFLRGGGVGGRSEHPAEELGDRVPVGSEIDELVDEHLAKAAEGLVARRRAQLCSCPA